MSIQILRVDSVATHFGVPSSSPAGSLRTVTIVFRTNKEVAQRLINPVMDNVMLIEGLIDDLTLTEQVQLAQRILAKAITS